jgi:hypothetical protein
VTNRRNKIFKINTVKCIIFFCSLLVFVPFKVRSQVTIYPIQNFNFGTFYQGNSGGTIDISTTGARSASGDIILMNTFPSGSQAIFDIEAPAGSIISLSTPDATLSGSNGGTVTLHISNTDPASPFNTTVVPPDRIRMQVAGSLRVGDRITSPPGTYQGTFSITFNQQ